MSTARILQWILLVVCISIVLLVRPSLPLDGDDGRNNVHNFTTALAGILGSFFVAALWRPSEKSGKALLVVCGFPLVAGGVVAIYFLFRGP